MTESEEKKRRRRVMRQIKFSDKRAKPRAFTEEERLFTMLPLVAVQYECPDCGVVLISSSYGPFCPRCNMVFQE